MFSLIESKQYELHRIIVGAQINFVLWKLQYELSMLELSHKKFILEILRATEDCNIGS